MATASSPIQSDQAELHSAFDESFYRLALQHFPQSVARALRPRVRQLAKSLSEEQPEKPKDKPFEVMPTTSIKVMAGRRHLSFPDYLKELADADHAEFVALKLATEAVSLHPQPAIEKVSSNDNHRTKISAKVRKKLIAARELGLSSTELCKRFGVASSTIRRIFAQEEGEDDT